MVVVLGACSSWGSFVNTKHTPSTDETAEFTSIISNADDDDDDYDETDDIKNTLSGCKCYRSNLNIFFHFCFFFLTRWLLYLNDRGTLEEESSVAFELVQHQKLT